MAEITADIPPYEVLFGICFGIDGLKIFCEIFFGLVGGSDRKLGMKKNGDRFAV